MTQLHTPTSNASNQETQDGLSTVKLVTPAGLYSSITSNGNVKQSLDNNSNATFSSNFIAKTATNVETQAGILNNKLVTPASLNSAINDAGTINTSITTIATNTATPIATSIATSIATTITNNAIATALPIRTYKDLTSSRQQDISYTNTTNTDLVVVVNVVGSVNLIHSIWVDGFIVCSRYAATSAGYVYYGTLEATVPPGSSYYYNSPSPGQVQSWIELSA